MTPERWRQVTEILHAAIARDPKARAAFLDSACRHDFSLRRSVESLLASHEAVQALGTAALLPFEPSLRPGTVVGPYRVEALIDVGGMGEVYEATDTQLHRTVALKVLAPNLAVDGAFQARFEREAQALAALNHPAVAAIYGLERIGERRAIVMEFVDGPTLADRLESGRLPLGEALRIGAKIAEALAAAHDRNVVHRDLKPSNIKIPSDGAIKLLDFGIAKTKSAEGRSRAEAVTEPSLTQQGMILGTAAYMSPEQARGAPIDKRADVWAFGCVLFEMITGNRAFDAESPTGTLAKILESEPAWEQLPAETPEPIRTLLRRCLRKAVDDRLRDMSDARLELLDTLVDGRQVRPATASSKRGRRVMWLATVGVVATAALAVWVIPRLATRDRSPAQVVEFGITLPPGVLMSANGAPVSPDGRRVAVGVFRDSPRILLYTLDTSEARLLPGTEGGQWPFWSPDGSSLGFFADDKIKRIDPDGGAPTVICDVLPGAGMGAWNADGVILFSGRPGLYRVPASGGTPTEVARGAPDASTYRLSPSFLSDNRHFFFFDGIPGQGTVKLGSLDSTDTRTLFESNYPAVFAPPDHVLFIRGTTLMAQSFDVQALRLTGSPSMVAADAAPGDLASLPSFSASRSGVLAYVRPRAGIPGQLTWFDRSGRAADAIASPDNTEYLNPALSPDSNVLAANVMDPQSGNWDIWTIDLLRNTPSRLTSDPARDADPVWSADGKEIAFVSYRGGRFGIYRKTVGTSEPEQLVAYSEGDPIIVSTTDWTRDGKYVLYTQLSPQTVWAVPTTGERRPFKVLDQFSPYGARVSPDGKWIGYGAFNTGTVEVYVERFLAPGQKVQVSHGGGVHPRWSEDGRELFYWAVPGGVNVVDLTFDAAGLHVGNPRSLVQSPVLGLTDFRPHYDGTRNGQRFLLRQPGGPPHPSVSLILNWQRKVK